MKDERFKIQARIIHRLFPYLPCVVMDDTFVGAAASELQRFSQVSSAEGLPQLLPAALVPAATSVTTPFVTEVSSLVHIRGSGMSASASSSFTLDVEAGDVLVTLSWSSVSIAFNCVVPPTIDPLFFCIYVTGEALPRVVFALSEGEMASNIASTDLGFTPTAVPWSIEIRVLPGV